MLLLRLPHTPRPHPAPLLPTRPGAGEEAENFVRTFGERPNPPSLEEYKVGGGWCCGRGLRARAWHWVLLPAPGSQQVPCCQQLWFACRACALPCRLVEACPLPPPRTG